VGQGVCSITSLRTYGCTDSALHAVLRMGIGGFGSGSSRRGSTNSSSSNSRAAAAAAAVRRAGEGFGLLTEDGGNGADADARYHLLQDPTDDWVSVCYIQYTSNRKRYIIGVYDRVVSTAL
jgi:hypothetical protein